MDVEVLEKPLAGSESPDRENRAQDSLNMQFLELSPGLNRLVQGLQTMEDLYAARFKERIAEVTELLREQITEELREQFDTELQASVEVIRTQFEERQYQASSQWDSERQLLNEEILRLRVQRNGKAVLEEIAHTEKDIERGAEELHRQINDPSVALSELMRIKARQVELKAYLGGLRFGIDTETSLPS
jgi:hypothetical protein